MTRSLRKRGTPRDLQDFEYRLRALEMAVEQFNTKEQEQDSAIEELQEDITGFSVDLQEVSENLEDSISVNASAFVAIENDIEVVENRVSVLENGLL